MFVSEFSVAVVFPAHAGMNRPLRVHHPPFLGVPRTRGDEPADEVWTLNKGMCSPHTRG